jgi:dipicolinate synthase subunit B
MIGFAMCGSYCTHKKAVDELKVLLSQGNSIQPIMSENVYSTDTYFGRCGDLIETVEGLCGRKVIHTVVDAEPLGPKTILDSLIICPCTGNTLAKLANGITDTSVCMAAKAHMRNDRPLIIALASNDALSANLKNIAALSSRKNIYFVPMIQDDPDKKPHSLVADFEQLPYAVEQAFKGKQIRPLFLNKPY